MNKNLEILSEDFNVEALKSVENHNHEIVEISERLRWKEDKEIDSLIDSLNLNDIIIELYTNGYDKNSEMYRYIYRSMGYSLFGYWEIFYWEVNNEDSRYYKFDKNELVGIKDKTLLFLNCLKEKQNNI